MCQNKNRKSVKCGVVVDNKIRQIKWKLLITLLGIFDGKSFLKWTASFIEKDGPVVDIN